MFLNWKKKKVSAKPPWKQMTHTTYRQHVALHQGYSCDKVLLPSISKTHFIQTLHDQQTNKSPNLEQGFSKKSIQMWTSQLKRMLILDMDKSGRSGDVYVRVCPLLFVLVLSWCILVPPQEHMARYLPSHLLQTAMLTLSAVQLLSNECFLKWVSQ